MAKTKHPATPKSESLSRLSIFGQPPVLEGEDAEAYNELLTQVSSAVKPADMIEEIWVHDVVDLTWEIFRWRRVKKTLIEEGVPGELQSVLTPFFRRSIGSDVFDVLVPPRSLCKLVKKWAAGDTAAISKVEKLMASANLTMEMVIDKIFLNQLEKIERIDHCLTITEARRNAALREIDRRRALFAQALRGTVREMELTEFKSNEAKAIAPKSAANTNAA